MEKSQARAYKFAFIAIFFWSTVATAFKISLEHNSVLQLLFLSSFFSFLILLVIVIYQKKLKEVKLYIVKEYKKILILSFINPFLYYLVLFKAYSILPAQEAQAINYSWALVLSYLAIFFLKQKLRFVDIIAGLICYTGVLVIATKGDILSLDFTNIYGVFLALFSTFLWAFYWIINTKNSADAVVGLLCNFMFSLPIIAIYGIYTQDIFLPYSLSGVFSSLYIGLFEMGLTFVLWLSAMQSATSTSKIANLIFISPFLSLVFIHYILGEKIENATILGLIFIIFGLLLQKRK